MKHSCPTPCGMHVVLLLPPCRGMVQSAFEFAEICRKHDYHNFLFSMKASNPLVMVQAYRLLAEEQYKRGWDYPLHLGVTGGRSGAAAAAVSGAEGWVAGVSPCLVGSAYGMCGSGQFLVQLRSTMLPGSCLKQQHRRHQCAAVALWLQYILLLLSLQLVMPY